MSEITDTRKALAETMTTAVGFNVDHFLPGRASVPFGFVIPGGPWLTAGLTFGSLTIHLEVGLCFQGVNNQTGTEDMDSKVETAVVALINAGWSVDEVSEPYELSMNNAAYLTVQLKVNRAIQL